jgi:hypothetical protein
LAVAEDPRYSMDVVNMGQQELDLLECLQRIDRGQPLDARADDLLKRLVEAGLVDSSDGDLNLTIAGIERCHSLMHRISGDKEAANVVAERDIELAKDPTR